MRRGLGGIVSGLLAVVLAFAALPLRDVRASIGPTASEGCVACHAGIEAMHPEAGLSCVDCHGGNASATLKSAAHIDKPKVRREDERTAALGKDLAWRRFRNPMDLRVMDKTCGTCHELDVEHLFASLHGTTAGHLSDGYYEMGLTKKRGSPYGIFPVKEAPEPGGAVSRLTQIPKFMARRDKDDLATHFSDLPRKECMQCHLWSEGRAVRGRVGFDGDYRGEGCAACHVEYELDGLSQSADKERQRGEPGHPRTHTMLRSPTTQTCTACHYGDASIGLHFRGLSQLPPEVPGGPNIPGTTDAALNRVFYMNDPALVPPDVHHERGMHCVDCHTKGDVMGDGKLHGQMEHAVEISCEACHGSIDDTATMRTERGTPLEQLRWDGERVILTSKVTGAEHVVKQVAHVVDPGHPDHNTEAARAMTSQHANVECYTCHSGWNVNFLGFHFTRNASLTQLDLIAGRRTPGRVTTQEKVFATWRSFYAGLNERGAVAPYLTGFSTMGSVWDESGELVLDQVMPVTAAGLSGMTMVHHQMHTTRPVARACVECHRTSTTWGVGGENFRLGRQLAFVADRRGIEVIGLDRTQFSESIALLKIPLPDVVDLAAHCDPLQGHAHHLYAAEGGRGVHVIDVRNPLEPRRVAFVATINPRALELMGDVLWVADGPGGLRAFDVAQPEAIHELGRLPMFDAYDLDVKWPWAYVADGPGGLAVVDIRVPIRPTILSAVDINGRDDAANEAISVESLFQYSRPTAAGGVPQRARTRARNLAAVLDARNGLTLVDVTEPTRPVVLFPRPDPEDETTSSPPRRRRSFRGLALRSQVDPAEAQGGERTMERDYAYVLTEFGRANNRRSQTYVIDITDPLDVDVTSRDLKLVRSGYATEQLVVGDFYNPPFRQRIAFTPGERGVAIADFTTSRDPKQLGSLAGIAEAYALVLEEFPLDRMIDESGARLKDVSRDGSRWLYRSEIERVLDVSPEALGTDLLYPASAGGYGITARLRFGQLDADGSGWLDGDELAAAGGSDVDANGDGRVSLLELAGRAGLAVTSNEPDPRVLAQSEGEAKPDAADARVARDGDLARLLDGVDPFAFDKDNDSRLARKEADQAVFAALDLDGDGSLVPDELSRYPGEWRQLRYGDARAADMFRTLGRTGGGRLSRREFHIQDAEWDAMDVDHDGKILLVLGRHEAERTRGLALDGSEWPARRALIFPLPPNVRAEQLLEHFDADGDGRLSRREMVRRKDLFAALDRDGSATVDAAEIERAVRTVARTGVDACPDDYLGRWDWDGSGTIEADEWPRVVRLRLAAHLAK